MWKILIKIVYGGSGGPRTVHSSECTGKDLPGALAEALAAMDREVITGLANAPLAVDTLVISLHFGRLVPRAKLSSAWTEAAGMVAGIVNIVPERSAVYSDPDQAGPGPKVEEPLTVNDHIARMATPGLDKEGGLSNG